MHYLISALNCVFVNTRGLLSKIDLLREYVLNKSLDVKCVAETFVNSEVLPAEVYINGYKPCRKDRCNFKAGKMEE